MSSIRTEVANSLRSPTPPRFRVHGQCALILVALCFSAQARVWTVQKDGSGDFTVIQDAVDAAASGDIIQIGPGRFEEWHTFTFPAGTADAYMLTRHAELTIVGSGPDVTIIGPVDGPGTEQDPIGIMTDVNTRLFVEDLTVENTDDGVQANGPYVSLTNCLFRSCEQGLDTVAWEGALVSDCTFLNSQCVGVMVFGTLDATNISVENSLFRGGLGGIDLQSQGSTIRDCRFEDLLVGVQLSFGAQATLRGNNFELIRNYAVAITGGARGALFDNLIGICPFNLGVLNGGHLEGSGNVLMGGTLETIDPSGSTATFDFHDNHILNAGGWTLGFGGSSTPRTFDFTNNWWGTTDAAQIDAWIRDAADGAINVTVVFEPFHGMPISTEQSSFGNLKSRFSTHGP